ncbi:Xaa-Pro aminopeptidase [Aliiroseovarius crassostreae]|nr:Xaa-Pro aminopeptidase [Aliiroseovarius crassostreae]
MLKRLTKMPDTAFTGPAQHIAALRDEMTKRGLDAFILPRYDAHQGEYVAPHDRRLAFVTGFTGSAGVAIVTQDIVAVFVDGRYSVQLGNECSGPLFSHHHLFDDPPEDWLGKTARQGWRVGYDPMHVPPAWFDRFKAACDPIEAALIAQDDNPVDAVWLDQPAPPTAQITEFPLQFAGKSCAAKCDDLVAHMKKVDADFIVDTQPDNIAWFLNVRGGDVEFNPLPHSFLLVSKNGDITWFVNREKLNIFDRSSLPDNVEVLQQAALLPTLGERIRAGHNVLIDPDFSPVAVRQMIEKTGARVAPERSTLTISKAHKNPTEIEGLRACHIQDGVAWTEFSAWLAQEVPARAAAGNPLSEREAEGKILELRKARPGFLSESFNSISAAAGNAAMCHYATTPDRNALILPENPYLLDSGGQYDTGTTDATRSFSFGPRPEGYDRAYTAVFKAFYALATLRFPQGTQGHHIDAICRRPLWDLGLDYDHGTGHGIGHRLSVHEHPQRIGKPVSPVDLSPGMVLSIEPGYYKADHYGIRIENLFDIVQEDDGFMSFRNMTFAPIQTDMLIMDALTVGERVWLEAYHKKVVYELSPYLTDQAKTWLLSK